MVMATREAKDTISSMPRATVILVIALAFIAFGGLFDYFGYVIWAGLSGAMAVFALALGVITVVGLRSLKYLV